MAPIEVTGGDSSTVAVETVTIPKTEFDEISLRASQSSQNFERLKKANETIEEYEARLAELDQNNAPPGSGEGDKRVEALEHTVQGLSETLALAEVLKTFPVIVGKEADFEAYRKDPANAGMSLATAAKAFVTDKGLIETRRPGLEAPTGGGHAPIPSGKLTPEQAAAFRTNNYKAYREALKRGDIQIEG